MSAGIEQLSTGTTGHSVLAYASEAELAAVVAGELRACLDRDAVALVLATAQRRKAFHDGLTSLGVDAAAAVASGDLRMIDAEQTLRRLLVDGRPDTRLFDTVIGGIVAESRASGRPLWIYGEMVALLWDVGLVNAAIEVEQLWNELGRSHPFSLLCAYPARPLTGDDPFIEVCSLHSAVTLAPVLGPTTWPASERQATRSFTAALDSPRCARRFAVATLESWQAENLIENAALVVTELATNAVLHARSGFTVTMSLSPGVLRVSVEDGGHGAAARRASLPADESGRGLALVAALATRWDTAASVAGKTVWAELTR